MLIVMSAITQSSGKQHSPFLHRWELKRNTPPPPPPTANIMAQTAKCIVHKRMQCAMECIHSHTHTRGGSEICLRDGNSRRERSKARGSIIFQHNNNGLLLMECIIIFIARYIWCPGNAQCLMQNHTHTHTQ